jgi:4-amino-4-deoxy-L-arabinose transferase-like glycosyltransferase
MVKNRLELFLIFTLILFSSVLRFPQLGFSQFYGDETKTLYLDKTVTAGDFLLSQRKGPMQFIVTWFMEKVTGTYSEFWMRLPFAVAGVLSVLVLYLLTRKIFGKRAAVISSLLYSVSGFSVAFSRTAQYQSFLILMGLLSIYFFIKSFTDKKYLLLSSFAFAISFLFHYDSIFYLVPLMILFYLYASKDRSYLKTLLIYFVIPALVICALFYIPYFVNGYFYSETFGYLTRRLSGKDYLPNNSFYTFLVYNPSLLALFPFLLSVLYFIFGKGKFYRLLFLVWFLVPFVVFEFVFKNPGTHILNYFLPLYIVSGAGFVAVFDKLRNKLLYLVPALVFTYLFVLTAYVYLPFFHLEYPWVSANFPLARLSRADKSYNLFLYGFPYNRGWDQIRVFFLNQNGVRGLYTNDNDTVAHYYLKEFNYTPFGPNFLPQYYISVHDNQEIREDFPEIYKVLDREYVKVREIVVGGKTTALIYKKL